MTPVDPAGQTARQHPAADRQAPETARSFEAVLAGQIAQLMFETVDTGEFSGGHGEEMFRGVLAERLGAEIARRGGIGIAPVVLDQILKLQGEAGNAR